MNWKKLQVRKPMAVFTTMFFLAFAVIGFFTGKDIPANLSGVMQVLAGAVIGGYFASSAWESCKAPKEDEPEDDK